MGALNVLGCRKSMKTETIQKYRCEKCGTLYGTAAAAIECEKRPITHDDVEIGEVVLITGGEGEGSRLKVESKSVLSRDTGRYWHTICVSGPVLGSWGGRMLTFDQRAPISSANVKVSPGTKGQ